jgi:hypothetical protein
VWKLVWQDGKFLLNNIAFELFLEIVEWFDKDESRQMRFSPSTLQFVWLGRKLFGTKFIKKNLFQFQNIYILSNGFPHLFGVEDPVKMSLSCFEPDINRMKRSPNNFLLFPL